VARHLVFGALVVVLAGVAALVAKPAAANPLTGVQAISSGAFHTCLVTTAAGAKCWGGNLFFNLGDGTSDNRNMPVDVIGLTTGVNAVAAGYGHSCAITTAGGVKCWGYNASGQLGNGTTMDSSTPVDVSGLPGGAIAIAAGNVHTCVITAAGGAKCWGGNGSGQLGNGTTVDSSTPVDVSGLTSGVTAIVAANYHTCAITTAGGAKCWGRNAFGQLGDGTTTDRLTPTDVAGLTSGVAAISAGSNHECAVTSSGAAKCWGYNDYGQLGNGTNTSSSTPVDVTGLSAGVTAVSTGGDHSCAVLSTGDPRCWGNDSWGQLGNGTITDSNIPVIVSGLKDSVAAISAGWLHTCALTTLGSVKCWGNNAVGQLGIGTALGPDECPSFPCSTTPLDVVEFGAKPTPTPTATPTTTATGTPTPQPTPTPPSVGGVSIDPGGGNTSPRWPWVFVGFASTAAVVGAVLLVRRRLLR
jgi:alpha-tubulin suppressor-like RCC1 family protein